MSRLDPPTDERLPLQLKLRLLESELERLEVDAGWIDQRRRELESEIEYYQQLLNQHERPPMLKRVK